jgi:hypothetical protein
MTRRWWARACSPPDSKPATVAAQLRAPPALASGFRLLGDLIADHGPPRNLLQDDIWGGPLFTPPDAGVVARHPLG